MNASIDDDAWHVDLVDPWIGELSLQQVHDGTLEAFKTHRLKEDGVSPTTLKRTLEIVRKILNASARSYRDDNGQIWLETAPLLTMPVLNPKKALRAVLGRAAGAVRSSAPAPGSDGVVCRQHRLQGAGGVQAALGVGAADPRAGSQFVCDTG